jgi:hypothetical protein
MCEIEAGDLVRTRDGQFDMLVIGRADHEYWEPGSVPALFCAWEEDHQLFEEVFTLSQLTLVRREQRRIPRGGELEFPRCAAEPNRPSASASGD